MLKKQFPHHQFHAHGIGFGAEITQPFRAVVESQAATAISPTGGFATSTAGPFNLRDIIRFEHAGSQIAAVEEEDSYDTVITSRIVGINILNQFTADEIVGHLSIKTMKRDSRMTFNTVGSRFVNLRVGGILIHPVLQQECDKPCGDSYAQGKGNPVYDLSIERGKRPVVSNVTTLVSELKVPDSCLEVEGNAIHVPDFGIVYLAEYLVKPYGRQLNMFRFELGCAARGTGSGSGLGANGSTTGP